MNGPGTTDPEAPPTLIGDVAVTGLLAALVQRGARAERDGHRDEARTCFESALRNLRVQDPARAAATLLRWVARTYVADGDTEAASDCAEAALAVAELSSDLAGAAHALNYLGVAHQSRGALDDAERLYQRAREAAATAGDVTLGAFIDQNLGIVANIRGDFDDALVHYTASLSAYRTLGLESHAAAVLVNIGMVHTDLGEWNAAFRAYEDATPGLAVHGDIPSRILLEVNRAELLVLRDRFQEAREACERAEALATTAGDQSKAGEIAKQTGVICRELGEYGAAEAHLQRAQAAARLRHDLLLLAETAREQAELYIRQRRYRDTLLSLNRAHRLFQQLRASHDLSDIGTRIGRLEDTFVEMVSRWGASIETSDAYTQGHCVRVAVYACALARASGMDERVLFWFRMGALLHDVGKIEVPAEILRKSDRLTPAEFEIMKRHPAAGERLMAGVDFPWDVRPMIRSHHERWDGRGYPDGLWGEEIPRAARLLCIADVYDALTTARPYRGAYSPREALSIMRAEAGRGFDPQLFATFEAVALSAAWPLEQGTSDRPVRSGEAGALATADVVSAGRARTAAR